MGNNKIKLKVRGAYRLKIFTTCVFALTILALNSSAEAANKCTSADGKVSFQDAPCVGGKAESLNLKSNSGAVPQNAAGAVGAASKPQSEAQRLEAQVAASVKGRRLYDLENVDYPLSLRLINQHRRNCEGEQTKLKVGQFAYVQNLYGKTHASQIASEMAAASARCNLKDRELKEQAETIKTECVKLGACKQQ